MRIKGILVCVIIPCMVAPVVLLAQKTESSSSQEWVRIINHEYGDIVTIRDETDASVGYGLATATSVAISGLSGNGICNAHDDSWGQDVAAQAVQTGLTDETWEYKGTRKSWAYDYVNPHISGQVNLINPDCAAAALGYADYYSTISGEITAFLDKSCAETEKDLIGDLSVAYKGLGVTIPINIGVGTGIFQDDDQNSNFGYQETDWVFWRARVRPFVKAYANDWWPGYSKTYGSVDPEIRNRILRLGAD